MVSWGGLVVATRASSVPTGPELETDLTRCEPKTVAQGRRRYLPARPRPAHWAELSQGLAGLSQVGD